MPKKLNYDYVKNIIESEEGYKLLSTKYKNSFSKIKIECPKGHIYEVRYNDFSNGVRCPYCAGVKHYSYEYVKGIFEKEGYKLLSTKYKNSKTKMRIECPKGHIFTMRFNNFQSGQRCPLCSNRVSKGEKDVLKYVQSLINEDVISNDRTQLINPNTGRGLELDIWIPSLRKAIEFNGVYWHKDREETDREKINQCNMKGINLLIISDVDWYDKKIQMMNRIKQWIL